MIVRYGFKEMCVVLNSTPELRELSDKLGDNRNGIVLTDDFIRFFRKLDLSPCHWDSRFPMFLIYISKEEFKLEFERIHDAIGVLSIIYNMSDSEYDDYYRSNGKDPSGDKADRDLYDILISLLKLRKLDQNATMAENKESNTTLQSDPRGFPVNMEFGY